MSNLLCFQINQHKTFQYIIVKHKINEVILLFSVDVLLSCHKSVSLSKLHQKFL